MFNTQPNQVITGVKVVSVLHMERQFLLPGHGGRSAFDITRYCTNEHRAQRQDLVLERPRPMILRYCSGETVPRPGNHVRIRDLWLGNDPSKCSDRQNRVEDFLVSQDGRYLVPIKASVRKAENLEEGDQVTIRLEVG